MKISKAFILTIMCGAAVFLAYQQGQLVADSAVSPAKIGIVNVTEVLENCQKHKDWQEKMKAEQAATRQEFEKMQDELEALRANLKLRTPGSEDYLKLLEDLTQKKALLEAKDKFYQTKVEDQMQQWTEGLYQQLLKVTETLAQSKGLDIVMADELMEVPAPTLRDFMLSIKTKKILFFNKKFDLTAEALAAMDNAGEVNP